MANAALHKDNIVRTAMRLFRQQGYASTGLQQILVESAAPKGSLYHYFPGGKEELGKAAVMLAGQLMGEMLSDLATKYEKPAAFVHAYCSVMAKWMEESEFRSGCPIATTMLETAPHSPLLTEAGVEVLDHWISIIAPVFVRSGLSMHDAKLKSQLLIASMEGALLLARTYQHSNVIMAVAEAYE
jgi:TetR/AcrR family transcriptional regulator, lmrAB and yxaGH operons repressor